MTTPRYSHITTFAIERGQSSDELMGIELVFYGPCRDVGKPTPAEAVCRIALDLDTRRLSDFRVGPARRYRSLAKSTSAHSGRVSRGERSRLTPTKPCCASCAGRAQRHGWKVVKWRFERTLQPLRRFDSDDDNVRRALEKAVA